MTELQFLTKATLTHLDRVLFPKAAITKAQVIQYYIKLAPEMLGILYDRPVMLTRYPSSVEKEGFFTKDAPQGLPNWVKTVKIYSKSSKRDVNYILINDLDTLVQLANFAAIEIHLPLSAVEYQEKPDFILFDLDPEPPATFQDSIQVACVLRDKLDKLGFKAYVKTSGKKGLHVVIPIEREYTFQVTRDFVHSISSHLRKEMPIVVSEVTESQQPGKVYIDYLQNTHARTMICPYSLRATPEATVSTPLEWHELEKKDLEPTDFTLFTVLKRGKYPWKNILECKQKLEVKKND